jgi:hypothetical protein
VFVLIVFIFGIVDIANIGFQKNNIILCIGTSVLSMLLILLDRLKVNPQLKNTVMKKEENDTRIESLKEEAWVQLSPINHHFYDGMCADLFSKTVPLITFDCIFDAKRFDYIVYKN